jgi:hypothetical protein
MKASGFLKSKGVTVENVNKFLFGTGFQELNKQQINKALKDKNLTYEDIYPYAYIGENIQTGISNKIVEEPLTAGAEIGVFAVLPSVIGKVQGARVAKAISNSKTVFVSEESLLQGKSLIKTISKTSIGQKDFFGFTQQGVLDVEKSTLGPVRLSSSRGLVITGNKKVYPIDYITERVNPIKDFGVSKVAGEAKLVKNILIGSDKQAMLDWTSTKIMTEQGQGVLSSIKVKNLDGSYTNLRTVGGFKSIPGEEAKFSYVGGDKLLLNIKNRNIAAKKNIIGIVTQKAEDVGGGMIKTSKGKGIFIKKEPPMPTESSGLIPGEVSSQRATTSSILQTQVQPQTLSTESKMLLSEAVSSQ